MYPRDNYLRVSIKMSIGILILDEHLISRQHAMGWSQVIADLILLHQEKTTKEKKQSQLIRKTEENDSWL